jgi:hypothetical protein
LTRRSHVYIPVRSILLGLSEAVLATLALVLAMMAYLGPIEASLALGNEKVVVVRVVLVVVLFVLCMYYFDLYDLSVLRNSREVLTNLIQCFGAFFVFLGILYSIFPSARLQMAIVLAGTGLAGLTALCWRHLLRYASHWPAFQERGGGDFGDRFHAHHPSRAWISPDGTVVRAKRSFRDCFSRHARR